MQRSFFKVQNKTEKLLPVPRFDVFFVILQVIIQNYCIMNRRYFIAGFTWGGESQKDRFINEKIWENGYDDKYQDVYNNIRIGDFIALKSTFVQGGKSVLRIHKIGVVRTVSKETMRVDLDWLDSIVPKDITDITWYANTLCEITNEEHIEKIFNMNANKEHIDWYESILISNRNLVLTGAPGTGKTYLAKQIAQKMIFGEVKDQLTEEEQTQLNEQCGFVQFHPSYDYTDFVEGLRPKNDGNGNVGFERKDGVFKEFCKEALLESDKPFVFIIDEINRGEISKIFGELFFSIDPGYRGEKGMVQTQYQNMIEEGDAFKKGFYVPENVYIIGTMNDIDRSVESMDFAMRRRFAWKEVTAKESYEAMKDKMVYAEEVKTRMTALNNAICDEKLGLNKSYQIGAAYFLKLDEYDGDFDKLWEYHLRGLLSEYLRGNRDAEKQLAQLKNAYDGNTESQNE